MSWIDRVRRFLGGAAPAKAGSRGGGEATRLRAEVVTHYSNGRFDAAAEAARRLLACQRKRLGVDHPESTPGLENLARLLQKVGENRKAKVEMDGVFERPGFNLGIARPMPDPRNSSDERAVRRPELSSPSSRIRLGSVRAREAPLVRPDVDAEPARLLVHAGSPSVAGDEGRKFALTLLERVLGLSYLRPGDLAPLRDAQKSALRARIAIEAGDLSGVPRLAGGGHPFEAMLTLVERREALSDRAWADLHEAVGLAFGHVLALAVSRGRIKAAEARETPAEDRLCG